MSRWPFSVFLSHCMIFFSSFFCGNKSHWSAHEYMQKTITREITCYFYFRKGKFMGIFLFFSLFFRSTEPSAILRGKKISHLIFPFHSFGPMSVRRKKCYKRNLIFIFLTFSLCFCAGKNSIFLCRMLKK